MKLTTASINVVYGDLLAASLSPATVRRIHSTLHRALRDAVRWGRLARNPAAMAELPKVQRSEMQTWTARQLHQFLDYVAEDRLAALWMLLGTTGMRRGEGLAVRWADLDLDRGRVSVRQSLIPVNGQIHFEEPKSGKGRSVALDAHTVDALRAHRGRQAKERLAMGAAYRDLDLVFAAVDGSPIAPGGVSQQFTIRAKRAGLPPIRLHDLRHTHATIALAAGVHPKVVSERLGYSTVALTLDLYSHSVPSMEEEAADRVAGLVFGS